MKVAYKKLITTVVASVVVCSSVSLFMPIKAVTNNVETAHNLVVNGDFSQIEVGDNRWQPNAPQQWDLWIHKDYKQVDHQIGVRDDGMLAIQSTDPFKAVVKQTIQVEEGKQYRLHYAIQTENLTKGAVFVRLLTYHDEQRIGMWETGVKKQRSETLASYEHEYTPESGVNRVVLELHYDRAVGQAIFDDVSLTEQTVSNEGAVEEDQSSTEQPTPPPVVSSLIKNGDFSNMSPASGAWTGKAASDWEVWLDKQITPTSYQVECTDEGVLNISSLQEPLRAVVRQTHKVSADTSYQLSYRLKTIDMSGVARVRIIERSQGKQKNLWYGPANVSGTNDWQTYQKTYNPLNEVDEVVVELFYDKGIGSVQFDDVALVATGTIDRNQAARAVPVEEELVLEMGKQYIPRAWQVRYEVQDVTVAQFNEEQGVITPLKEGRSTVRVYDNQTNQLLAEIPLTVEPAQPYSVSALDLWNDIIAGNSHYDANNEAMRQQNEKMDNEVMQLLNEFNTSADRRYLWADAADYEVSANITKTYRKLELLAKQLTQPQSKYYQNAQGLRIIKNSLEWLHTNVYNKDKDIVGNWWDYEIGTPRAINNTLSLLHRYFSLEEMKHYTDVIDKFVPDPTKFRYTTDPFTATGGNLIDMGRVKIIEALLRNDDMMQRDAIASLSQALQNVTSGEGFYEDGSHIAHTNVAYNGGYGSVLIDGLSQLIPVVQASQYPLTERQSAILYQWIERAFLPMLYNGELFDLTRGRSVSREKQESHVAAAEILRGILRIAEASDPAMKQMLQREVKGTVSLDRYYSVFKNLPSYRDIYLMQQVLNDPTIVPADPQTALRIYHNMDKVVFHQAEKEFAWALSMHSSRTQNYEYMNKENARGWYTADGMTYLYNEDGAQYSDGYWPTVTANRLTGTTVLEEVRTAGDGQVTMASSFVGGAKLNEEFGSMGMMFHNWNDTLRMRKAWFVLKDKIVYMGAGLENQSSQLAITTIENRKVGDSNYRVYVNGVEHGNPQEQVEGVNSLFYESPQASRNIGYYFLTPLSLQLDRQQVTGSWQEINGNGSADPVMNEFVIASHTHDEKNTEYAYVLLPNRTLAEMNSYEKQPTVAVLSNDNQHQVVFDREYNVWGIVKYDDSAYVLAPDLTLKHAGFYMVQQTDSGYIVAMHHPTAGTLDAETIVSSNGKVVLTATPTAEVATHYVSVTTKENNNATPSINNETTDANQHIPKSEVTARPTVLEKTEKKQTQTDKITMNKKLPDTGSGTIVSEVTLVGASLLSVCGVTLSRKK